MAIHTSIHEATFPTPLLELQAAGAGVGRVLLKAEFLAPLGNIEDRWSLLWQENTSSITAHDSLSSFVVSANSDQERLIGSAQSGAVLGKQVIATSTHNPDAPYHSIARHFGVAEVNSEDSSTDKAARWSGYLPNGVLVRPDKDQQISPLNSLFRELAEQIKKESFSNVTIYLPLSHERAAHGDELFAIERLAENYSFTLIWVWWAETLRFGRIRRLSKLPSNAVCVERDDAILMTHLLARRHGLLATLPTAAVVCEALRQSNEIATTNNLHIAIGCRLYNREENHNPIATHLIKNTGTLHS